MDSSHIGSIQSCGKCIHDTLIQKPVAVGVVNEGNDYEAQWNANKILHSSHASLNYVKVYYQLTVLYARYVWYPSGFLYTHRRIPVQANDKWLVTTTQRTRNVIIASLLHQNDAATSFWCDNDIIITSLSGVPDYFDRNKILSGYDLSHYQVPHCIKSFLLFCLICVYTTQFSILF